MKLKLPIILLLALSASVFAQDISVSGTITDNETGEVLPGVNIVVENTTTGAISDVNGNYTILAPRNGSLLLSFIGYMTETIPVEGRTQINLSMIPSSEELDEVVVVGYGTMRRSDLTGALSRIQETEEVASQYSGVDALLQGRVAGIQVSANAGNLGGAVSVRIRGTNSLRGNNEPLYVIDGVIINSAGEDVVNASSDANEIQTDQNGLTGLNVRDIESVEVLKDASATAIYGSRGANGVILITTKSGKSIDGRPVVNAYVNYETSTIAKKIDVLDAVRWADYQNEWTETVNGNPKFSSSGGFVYPVTYVDTVATIGETPYRTANWQEEIYIPSQSVNTGFSVSGNNEGTKYFLSGSYNDDKGIVETTNIKRGDFRMNLSQELSSKLSVDTRTSLMFQDGSFAQAGSKSGGNRSFTKQMLTYRPLVGDSEDEIDDLDLEISNPEAWLTDFDDLTKEIRANLSASLTYEIIEGLKYKIQGGADYRNKSRTRWYGTETFKGNLVNGYANYSDLVRYSYTLDNLLLYTKQIKSHRINATVGTTYDGVAFKNSTYEISDFPVQSLRSIAPQSGQLAMTPYGIDYRDEAIFSVLGRLNYSYKSRYILTASLRSDKSSKFQPGNQTGYFPSFAFAWRMSNEKFLKKVDWLYNLKMRVGYGEVGNSGIPPYQTLFTYNTNYYVNSLGSTIIGNSPSRIANKNLTWETTKQVNAGLDFALFDGRLSGVFDIYQKLTDDLLLQKPIPESTGYSSITVNQGSVSNKGVELALDAVVLEKKDMMLSIGGNISMNKSRITKLGLPAENIYIDGEEIEREFYLGSNVSTGTYFKAPANIFMVDEEIGMFWGLETDGIVQSADTVGGDFLTYKGGQMRPGDVKFIDHNGDGNIDDGDKTFIGNPNPDFVYGFNLVFQYKKLSVRMLFDGSYGNEIINGYNLELGYAEGRSSNILAEAYEQAWREASPSNTYPRVDYRDNSSFISDRQVEDGSYFRMNSLSVSYELPKMKGIRSASVTLSARNIFTLTKYSGFDPQVTSFLYDGTILGVDWVGTPNVKTYMVGVNINF